MILPELTLRRADNWQRFERGLANEDMKTVSSKQYTKGVVAGIDQAKPKQALLDKLNK